MANLRFAIVLSMAMPRFSQAFQVSQSPTPILDVHVHLTNMTLFDYLWANASAGVCPCAPPCACTWTIEDWEGASNTSSSSSSITPSKFVFVEVDVNSTQWLAEATYVQSLADAGGPQSQRVGAIVAQQPPGFGVVGVPPSQIDALLASLQQLPLAHGIRASGVNYSDPVQMATVTQHAALLAARNMSLDVNAAVWQPGVAEGIAALATSFPSLTLILDHAGSAPVLGTPAQQSAWQDGMATLGSLPNVYVKLGGILQGYKGRKFFPSLAEVAPWVTYTVSAFGFGRSAFEANWFFCDWLDPADLDVYEKWTGYLDIILTGMGAGEGTVARDLVLRRAGAAAYRVQGMGI